MPNCIQFTKKGSDRPISMNKLDEEICGVLGVEVHPTAYVVMWFDRIAGRLAVGASWEDIEATFKREMTEAEDEEEVEYRMAQLSALNYLRENYQHSAWYEMK